MATLSLPSITAALALTLTLAAAPARAQAEAGNSIAIGIAAPTSGPAASLGAQVVAGARQAVAGHAGATLIEVDTRCSPDGGREAAARFVGAKVAVVAGFLCTEALEAALPALTAAGIPVVTSGVRTLRLTDRRARTGALLWRLAPRADAAAEALSAAVAGRWKDLPFGLVDDGTVDGRGLSDAVRSRLEAAGLKPVLVDTYRPADEKQFGLVRRIAASGVTRLVVLGDRPDIAVIGRDAREDGLSLEIVGGEALFDEPGPVPLPAGILAVAPLRQFPGVGDETAPIAPEEREGAFGPAFAASEIALEAAAQAARTGRPLADILSSTRFPTALGPVRFDAKGDSSLNLYRTFRFDGADFVLEAGG